MATQVRRRRATGGPANNLGVKVQLEHLDINDLVPYAFNRDSGKRKYRIVGDCFEWLGVLDPEGYGQICIAGKTTRVHRFVYAQLVGPIEPGQVVRHSCDNPCCINPAHLVAGTQYANIRDKVHRGRQARGSAHGMARLSWRVVALIRRLYLAGEKQVDLAVRFGVTQTSISSVVLGKTWRTE